MIPAHDKILRVPPTYSALLRGAVRESLAWAHSVSKIGIQDTRAWEAPLRYVADDNEGSVGILSFEGPGVVAAVHSKFCNDAYAWREDVLRAPKELRASLTKVCELPLLQEGVGVTAVFWAIDTAGTAASPHTWDSTYRMGADVFENECLSDDEWVRTAREFYGLPDATAQVILQASNRAVAARPVVALTQSELHSIIPTDAAFRDDASKALFTDGIVGRQSHAMS